MDVDIKIDAGKMDADTVKAVVSDQLDKAPHSKSRTGYFAEVIDLREAQINEAENKVRVTLIKPGWSANGRYYSREVLGKAAPMFEGTKAYFDHPSTRDIKERPERSVRDLAGWYENVTQEADGRLSADFNVDHPDAWRLVETTVKRRPDYAGLSINALGSTRLGEAEGRKGVLVENIAKANSTDLVTTPAAGGALDRLMASDTDGFTRDLLEAMPLNELQETLREARPDLLEALKREWKTTRDTKAIEEARASADTATQQVTAITQEKQAAQAALTEALSTITELRKERLVDSLLDGKKLPDDVRKELRGKLLAAADTDAMLEVLNMTMTVLGAVRLPVRVTGSGRASSLPVTATTAPRHAVAEVLGINPALAKAETIDEFLEARKHSTSH